MGVGLALVTASGDTSVSPYLALAVGAGIAMAIGSPAARAMSTTLVSPDLLQSAMTLRSIATQMSQVVGPALGGLLYATSPTLVYLLSAGVCLSASACVIAMRARPAVEVDGGGSVAPGLESVLEGLRFVGRTQILLGAILLDLLAVPVAAVALGCCPRG